MLKEPGVWPSTYPSQRGTYPNLQVPVLNHPSNDFDID